MITFERTVTINCPRDRVFDFVSDPGNDAHWRKGSRFAEWTSEGVIGAGSTMRSVDHTVITSDKGPRMELRGVVERSGRAPNTWYTEGYKPFPLEERFKGKKRFAPYNLVSIGSGYSAMTISECPSKSCSGLG